jgi:hypothetical protein
MVIRVNPNDITFKFLVNIFLIESLISFPYSSFSAATTFFHNSDGGSVLFGLIGGKEQIYL